MDRCPLCRAMLNGAETCRRCRAELGSVIRVASESRALAGAAMRHLALDDREAAARLLRRALTLHAAPEIRTLFLLVGASAQLADDGLDDEGLGSADEVGSLDRA